MFSYQPKYPGKSFSSKISYLKALFDFHFCLDYVCIGLIQPVKSTKQNYLQSKYQFFHLFIGCCFPLHLREQQFSLPFD